VTIAPARQREDSGTATAQADTATVPRLADGIDLIGEYEGSGFKEPHYLARRADGQVIQLSHLLYLTARAVDGSRAPDEIAECVSLAFDKKVSAANVEWLVENKLRPLGVVTAPDGSSPDVTPLDPLLALRWRTGLVPERAVARITSVFKPLFFPPVIVAAIVGILGLDYWLFFTHGLAQGARQTLYQPLLFLMVFALVVLSAAFHEVGHATACSYGGAKPGKMGAGLYLVWPAFYTDVTDAYRLDRRGRLRTDLGGVYFNILFALATAGVYALTGFEPLLIVVFLLQLEIVQQMLPFLRMDGYYVVSDLTGVPDLFARIKPILTSFLPGRPSDPRVDELKRWVRFAVTAWVLVVIPILVFNLVMIAVNLPKLMATGWDSITKQAAAIGPAFSGGQWPKGLVGMVQILALGLPMLGIVFMFWRLGRRAGGGAWRWSAGSSARRATLLTIYAVAAVLLAIVWWPDHTYRPYQPGEKGTLVSEVRSAVRLPAGRPALHDRGSVAPVINQPSPGATPAPLTPVDGVTPTPTSGGVLLGETPGATPSPGPASATTSSSPAPSASASAPTASNSASPSASPLTQVSP
jgi:putative peptide zinc metalloprotease protein